MTKLTVLKIASMGGFLAVFIGAFGAHALQDLLLENQREQTFNIGVRYHFYHIFALFICAMLFDSFDKKLLTMSVWLFLIGILIFSGSLYLLSITNISLFGSLTPFGGLCLLGAWVLLFMSIVRGAGIHKEI